MPIEIKELHIRITVNAPENGHPATPLLQAAPAGVSPEEKELLVAECVEQVLRILKAKQER